MSDTESEARAEQGSICSSQFDIHREDLRRFISRMIANDNDVDDLVQESFLRVLNRIGGDGANEVSEPRAYLFVTASNLIKDRIRAKKRAPDSESFEYSNEPIPSVLAGPERLAISSQLKSDLLSSLKSLDSKARQVFLLHRFDAMSHVQIADQLDVNVRTVERRMATALKHIRAHLREYL